MFGGDCNPISDVRLYHFLKRSDTVGEVVGLPSHINYCAKFG